jgi:hypothetical protein
MLTIYIVKDRSNFSKKIINSFTGLISFEEISSKELPSALNDRNKIVLSEITVGVGNYGLISDVLSTQLKLPVKLCYDISFALKDKQLKILRVLVEKSQTLLEFRTEEEDYW